MRLRSSSNEKTVHKVCSLHVRYTHTTSAHARAYTSSPSPASVQKKKEIRKFCSNCKRINARKFWKNFYIFSSKFLINLERILEKHSKEILCKFQVTNIKPILQKIKGGKIWQILRNGYRKISRSRVMTFPSKQMNFDLNEQIFRNCY